jgi:hypothetical protein
MLAISAVWSSNLSRSDKRIGLVKSDEKVSSEPGICR